MGTSYTTYSFSDVTGSFSHPNVGSKSTTGAGLGSITTSQSTTKTAHEVSADGRVMISKIAGENGTVAITMQQTSELHQWFLSWYNYINGSSASTDDWAAMSLTIKNNNLGEITTCTGVSPEKLADRPYQAQGQNVTWNLMAAEITTEGNTSSN
ncbi:MULTISPECIES: phage protein [unclassified Clostridium]|uniref:phage protein n=1 Tax=unclassified Clostridium TaxID=2614128 RepID=UPI000297EADA|nr:MULTISPECIES: phage protein [unclassified Clostridium]EKQ56268.1 MAG: Protein of unknown function (DUF3277) [Clostridium sp. Maddingley MBC34-26]